MQTPMHEHQLHQTLRENPGTIVNSGAAKGRQFLLHIWHPISDLFLLALDIGRKLFFGELLSPDSQRLQIHFNV
jgi:hypothetical protein